MARRHRQVEFLGLGFAQATIGEILEDLRASGREQPFAYVVTPNVDHMVRLSSAADGAELKAAYRGAAVRLCDSRVLARLGRVFGIRLSVVPGSDLTARLLEDMAGTGRRIAVIGADSTALDRLRDRYSGLEFLHHAPPMRLLENRTAMAEAVAFAANARADIVLLAVGSPQQEILAHAIMARGDARGTGLCIGASIDFLTGRARRAPRLIQKMGFEWGFRLLTQPRRLWRRYLVDGPRILGIALTWRYGRQDSGS